ncbi:ATP-binding cassette domain-containing protein [Evansella halocellulosilytica]|uniref:ATP-binding cassette domain-containing protein n=1 Tax=Evansella halocellulosilytica TaxID=2011013 RepID=UPI000BB9219E|nr:ABC transporter ATP-binding protein [Evansella halocellulosilytica]
MTVIACEKVSKAFHRQKALNDVSFKIRENTITGVIGRNGAGKTTLLEMIAGLKKPTSGSIEVLGQNPFNNLFVSANSIFIDDLMAFPDSMNVDEILTMAAMFYPNWDEKIARGLLNYFQINEKQRHKHLSKGKTSTFNAIIGIASRCPVTIFDEPTTGMDESVRRDFYRALLKDYLEMPRTVLISSHHVNEIEDLLENLLLIHNGKVHLHESMDEMKQYVIKVTGPVEAVREVTKGKLVLHEEGPTPNHQTAVIRVDGSKIDERDWRNKGLKVTYATPGEVCVYLTQHQRGGIDDVYRRT